MKKILILAMSFICMMTTTTYAKAAEEYIVPLKVVKESSKSEESMGAKAIRPEVKVIKNGQNYEYIFESKSMNYQNLNGHLTNLFYLDNNNRKEAVKGKAAAPYETSFTVTDSKKDAEMVFAVWVDAMDEIMGGTPGAGEQKVIMLLDWSNAKSSIKEETVKKEDTKNNINIEVKGKKIKMDVSPYINNGRTMVPVRFISEELNLNVIWDKEKRTVTVQDQNQKVELTIGSDKSKKNNEIIKLDSAPEIKNGRTFVPVRAIAELFNSEVKWDQSTRTVFINK